MSDRRRLSITFSGYLGGGVADGVPLWRGERARTIDPVDGPAPRQEHGRATERPHEDAEPGAPSAS